MALSKLFNLFVLSSVALFLCTLDAAPVVALSHGNHMAKRAGHDVRAVSLKKSKRQRCKARDEQTPTPSATPSSSAPPDSSYTPSSSSSSSAAPSQTPVSSGSTKLGLAWGADPSLLDAVLSVNSGIKYIYNWNAAPDPSFATHGLTFMSMLWGDDQSRISAFQQYIQSVGPSTVMGFNEYNEQGQANMDPTTMANVWNQYIAPLHQQGFTTYSPVSSSNPNGLTQFQTFAGLIDMSTIDVIALHYYGTSAQDMITYIEGWITAFPSKQFAITEYACQDFTGGPQCDEDQVLTFYQTVINYVNGNSQIILHCPFGFLTDMQGVNQLDSLLTSTGLTDLGQKIVSGNFNS